MIAVTRKMVIRHGKPVYHGIRLTMTCRDGNGYDLRIETDDAGKFTKEAKESSLQFNGQNMSFVGLESFAKFAESLIGADIGNAILDLAEECHVEIHDTRMGKLTNV